MAHHGVTLTRVYPSDPDARTDVDIIAVHGPEATFPDAWTCNSQEPDKPDVSWLQDVQILPSRAGSARVFTCDWPKGVMQPQELVRCLLVGIDQRPGATDGVRQQKKPIVFIASSLGGIILVQALVLAHRENPAVQSATRGIIFLATPFHDASVKKVVDWALLAKPSLEEAKTSLLDWPARAERLESVRRLAPLLQPLIGRFIELVKEMDPSCPVYSFCETDRTSLPRQGHLLWRNIFGSLGSCCPPTSLVDKNAASLETLVSHPVVLNRPHAMMSRFSSPHDPAYSLVAGAVEDALQSARQTLLLKEADTLLREEYYNADRLRIERLTGDPIPMDQCSICLVPLKPPGELFVYSVPAWAMEDERPVELQTIFSPDGQRAQTRRILIRGYAGAGKTTLCKKIAHDFVHCDLWKGLFDRVLCVPLRHFKCLTGTGWSAAELFRREYFPGREYEDGCRLAEALWRAVQDTGGGRTLFVLDGLDEVAHLCKPGEPGYQCLWSLLNQPSVVITCRNDCYLPDGLKHVFRELEVVGVGPHEVKRQLRAAIPDAGVADAIWSCPYKHWLFLGLVRIPALLDMFCFIWEGTRGSGPIPQSMTGLYDVLDQGLREKERRLRREAPTEHGIKFVEILAFSGFYSNMAEFDQTHHRAVCSQFDLSLAEGFLQRSPALRASAPSPGEPNHSYRFLHLSLQQYFAAQYFVRQWIDGKPLGCLQLATAELTWIEPAVFLGKHKYNERYNLVWHFAAGLLDGRGGQDVVGFFHALEDEPLDLLGPAHQRLVMQCLRQVSLDMPLRKPLERRMVQWLVFEHSLTGRCRLATQVELPEAVLDAVLREGCDELKRSTLNVLAAQPRVPASILRLAASWVRDGTNRPLAEEASKLFRYAGCHWPSDDLDAAVAMLADENETVRRMGFDILRAQPVLPRACQEELVAMLQLTNGKVWCCVAAVATYRLPSIETTSEDAVGWQCGADSDSEAPQTEALHHQPASASMTKILEAAAVRLDDENSFVRLAAISLLHRHQSVFCDEILIALVARLSDPDLEVRRAVAELLHFQPALSGNVLRAVLTKLGNEDPWVQQIALGSLPDQPILADDVLGSLVGQLGCQDWAARQAAIHILTRHSPLSEGVADAVAAWLRPGVGGVDAQCAALAVLSRRAETFRGNLLKDVVMRLQDGDPKLQYAAVKFLGQRSSLPDEVLQIILALTQSSHWPTRQAVINVLSRQSALPDDFLQAVLVQLKDKNSKHQSAALIVLINHFASLLNSLRATVARLGHDDKDVRNLAMGIWRSQVALFDQFLEAIADNLKLSIQNSVLQQSVVEFLGSLAALSSEIPKAIAAELGHMHWDVQEAFLDISALLAKLRVRALNIVTAAARDHVEIRNAAIGVLEEQSPLPDEILRSIAPWLKSDGVMRYYAAGVVACQATLPDGIRQDLLSLLGDEVGIRIAIGKYLRAQPSLSDEMLDVVERLLEDPDVRVQDMAASVLRCHPAALSDKMLDVVVRLLKDPDARVQDTAARVLRCHPAALSNKILQAVVPLLQHTDAETTAFHILYDEGTLSDEVLEDLIRLLDDPKPGVRISAITILHRKSPFSKRILEAIATLLRSITTIQYGEDLIQSDGEFYASLLAGQSMEALYYYSLRHSFREKRVWYIEGGVCNVRLRRTNVTLHLSSQRWFVNRINSARPAEYPK